MNLTYKVKPESANLFFPSGPIEVLEGQEKDEVYVFVEMSRNEFAKIDEKIQVEIYRDNELIQTIDSRFPGPNTFSRK